MAFSVNNLFFKGQIAPLAPVNPQPVQQPRIGLTQAPDTFESKNPAKYTSEYMINKLAVNNNQLQAILKNAGIHYNLNMTDLNKTLEGHCTDTRNIAEGIVHNLPFALESKADLNAIKNAAYLHDIGKVFIPSEILNKTEKLTDAETEIVHKHAELGYELLKNSDLDKKTLSLIRNHHQDAKKSGYPFVSNNFNANLDLQILSTADKYSALTEKRPYKEPMNREQALTIIRSEVRNGKINPLIFNALVNYTDEVALPRDINNGNLKSVS